MRRPVGVDRRHRLAGALVHHAGRQRLHGDAVLDRADIDAQIAADALVVDHLEMRWPSSMLVIAWCEVSSQAMWQRPHLMQASWSIRALVT